MPLSFSSLRLGFRCFFSQSKPQKNGRPAGEGKKNRRPTEEEKKKAEEERCVRRKEERRFDPTVEKIETNVVNVDAVVYNKKTGQIISGPKEREFCHL